MDSTEVQLSTATKLTRIAWLSSKDSSKQFDCLMHLVNAESLADCYHRLDGRKAVGIDGVTKSMVTLLVSCEGFRLEPIA